MSWEPEIVVTKALARQLVAEQFPELAREPVAPLGAGWDYTAFRVGPGLVFRFPRRAVVLPGMEREVAVLPRLAPALPLAVPAAEHVGEPSEWFPWRFFGARFIPGEEPLGLDEDARHALAAPLARALRALHGCTADELPEDGNRRADMARRVPWTRAALAEIGVEAEDVLAQAERLSASTVTVVCHGDLHLRQVLVDDGRLSGIIDWVDICRGDPAIDLSLLWSLVPRDAFDGFLAEYGSVSEESLLRARVLALGLNATLAAYARAEGNEPLEREALAGVRRAATP
jgi:aminoglycoside phosphotransferase (APT) family kinase protein